MGPCTSHKLESFLFWSPMSRNYVPSSVLMCCCNWSCKINKRFRGALVRVLGTVSLEATFILGWSIYSLAWSGSRQGFRVNRSFLGGNEIRQICILRCLDRWPLSWLHKDKAAGHVICSSTTVIRVALASLQGERQGAREHVPRLLSSRLRVLIDIPVHQTVARWDHCLVWALWVLLCQDIIQVSEQAYRLGRARNYTHSIGLGYELAARLGQGDQPDGAARPSSEVPNQASLYPPSSSGQTVPCLGCA